MSKTESPSSGSARESIDRLIESGDFAGAREGLAALWRSEPGPAAATFVTKRVARCTDRQAFPVKVAFLRSFTLEPVLPMLRAAAALQGIDVTTHLGDFNTYAQEILDPASTLYKFEPNVIFLAVQTRDIAPELWDGFAELSRDAASAAAARVVEHFSTLVEQLRSRSPAAIVMHLLESPGAPAHGLLDAQVDGQSSAIDGINRELRRLAARVTGLYLLDYDRLIAGHGRTAWDDEQRWLTARLPITAACLPALAEEWLRFLHPLSGRVAKALVVDLDNTLWRGVVGEDGVDGIEVGPDGPGAAFLAVQRVLLNFYQRGILLAIASKNNPDDAREALERHTGMLLRPHHFAAQRLNWQDKAQSLREIAQELNIGVDALAFLDDNPVERQWVRRQSPEVHVIELPEDPREYAAALLREGCFERLYLADEDRERGAYYAGQKLRADLEHSAASLPDFYRSLAMTVEIRPMTAATLPRIAQLTQKTNQFNLTTRRYQAAELERMAAAGGVHILGVRVVDRFGDNGLVGVVLVRERADEWEIDTFLLSCRVIGRTVETAILATLARQAAAAGASRLSGWFAPTAKNAPAKDFYESHGFRRIAEADGSTHWELDLRQAMPECPDWITLDAAMETTHV